MTKLPDQLSDLSPSVPVWHQPRFRTWLVAGWIVILVGASIAFHLRVRGTLPGREDTFYAWQDGERLAHGENPYARVLAGDMHSNNSYATYFPTYYLLSAGFYRLGVTDYLDWLKWWRPVCELSHLAIAVLLLLVGVRAKSLALGLFASGFFFFSRWTITVVNMAHLDTLALLLLLLALQFSSRKPVACLLFGASLAVKQMAIFLFPLWLILAYFEGSPGDRLRRTWRACAWTAAIPLLLTAPFLVWNAPGFIKSILFSATRDPVGDFTAKSIDASLGFVGLIAKMPMLGLMALVYLVALLKPRAFGRYGLTLLIFATFLDFNSVLFVQYMVWTVPLIPLAMIEMAELRSLRLPML